MRPPMIDVALLIKAVKWNGNELSNACTKYSFVKYPNGVERGFVDFLFNPKEISGRGLLTLVLVKMDGTSEMPESRAVEAVRLLEIGCNRHAPRYFRQFFEGRGAEISTAKRSQMLEKGYSFCVTYTIRWYAFTENSVIVPRQCESFTSFKPFFKKWRELRANKNVIIDHIDKEMDVQTRYVRVRA